MLRSPKHRIKVCFLAHKGAIRHEKRHHELSSGSECRRTKKHTTLPFGPAFRKAEPHETGGKLGCRFSENLAEKRIQVVLFADLGARHHEKRVDELWNWFP